MKMAENKKILEELFSAPCEKCGEELGNSHNTMCDYCFEEYWKEGGDPL